MTILNIGSITTARSFSPAAAISSAIVRQSDSLLVGKVTAATERADYQPTLPFKQHKGSTVVFYL